MVYAGGVDLLTAVLDEFGPDTVVTVSLAAPPGGTNLTPATTPNADRSVWTATPAYDLAGRWAATWTVTGTGATVWAQEVWVERIPGAAADVPWAPSLPDVAGLISRFTIDVVTPGSVAEYGTFNDRTAPTNTQASRIVAQVVDGLAAHLGTVAAATRPLARQVAALRAAAAIARSYNRSAADLALADSLDRRADAEWARLLAVDTATDGTAETVSLVPVWSFPGPPTWGDTNL